MRLRFLKMNVVSWLMNQLSSLRKVAKNLRISNDTGKGSELAEILLYGVMKHHYKTLPVVPKIFYKQNCQDNVKGADSAHIVLEDDGSFSLWYGESKFYVDLLGAKFVQFFFIIFHFF